MSEEVQVTPEVIETPIIPIEQPRKSNAGSIIAIVAAIMLCCCCLFTALIIYGIIYAGVWIWYTF